MMMLMLMMMVSNMADAKSIDLLGAAAKQQLEPTVPNYCMCLLHKESRISRKISFIYFFNSKFESAISTGNLCKRLSYNIDLSIRQRLPAHVGGGSHSCSNGYHHFYFF
jgi:hypothetical protein